MQETPSFIPQFLPASNRGTQKQKWTNSAGPHASRHFWWWFSFSILVGFVVLAGGICHLRLRLRHFLTVKAPPLFLVAVLLPLCVLPWRRTLPNQLNIPNIIGCLGPKKTPFKERFLVRNRDLFGSPLSQSNRSTCVQTKVFCYRRYWPKCCTQVKIYGWSSGLNMYNTNKIQVLPISMPVEPATFQTWCRNV